MFRLIQKVFIVLLSFSATLASIVNVSDHAKCISLNNQPCLTQLTLIDLKPEEFNPGLSYYSFMVIIDRCNGSSNSLGDPPTRISVPHKVFHVITKNESKTLTKHISCKCKCKFDGRTCNANQKWKNKKCRYECNNQRKHVCKGRLYLEL